VGVTDIFVPEDLEFMGTTAAELRHFSSRLVPLMAHDRAGFGGAVLTVGITTLCCLWCAIPSRSLWEANPHRRRSVVDGRDRHTRNGRLHRHMASHAGTCSRRFVDRGSLPDDSGIGTGAEPKFPTSPASPFDMTSNLRQTTPPVTYMSHRGHGDHPPAL
jgi:hypothetical protein